MASTTPYIPPKDADLDVWATNFSGLLTANPATYGLTSGDATIVAGVYNTWHTAFLAATNNATRGPMTIQTKNDARTSMLATIRPYAQLISRNAGVSADDKVAIGVNPRTSIPTPVPEPTSFPVLGVRGGTPGVIQVQYTDNLAPDGKAKPFGATQMQVFAETSVTPITDPADITFNGVATKSPFNISFDASDYNKTCYIAARWMTRDGKVGPWSNIIAGTVMAA